MTPPLTILVTSINGEDKLEQILPGLRAVADELVVGVDDSSTDDTAGVARKYADTMFSLPHDSFFTTGEEITALERSMPHCTGEWILRVDHDETLSAGWSDRSRVAELLADRQATHYYVPRRWAIPPGDRFISSANWYPDYSVRLFRNLPSLLRAPRQVHTDLEVLGEGRSLTHEWLIHWDLVWHTRAVREAKVQLYESLGPTSLDRQYLFEERTYDTRPIDAPVLDVPAYSPLPLCDDEIGCWIEAVEPPATMVSGAKQFLLITVRNLSRRVFLPGVRGGCPGNVMISHHWLDAAGAPVEPWDQLRVELPTRLAPGQATAMYLPILAAPPPGSYFLQPDLVEEGVAWATYRRRLPVYPITTVDGP